MFVDTHCHLNLDRFKNNKDEVIKEARIKGVSSLIIPGVDVTSSQRAVEIAGNYSGLFPAVGIHPGYKIGGNWLEEAKKIDELVENYPSIVAVGEIGLDTFLLKGSNQEHDRYEIQKKLFTYQLSLAIKHKKSVIVHSREALKDTIAILDKYWDTSLQHHIVLHCCEPETDLLDFARGHHLFIGVDGDVTYDLKKQWYIEQVPLDMLVLETDSPFLLPEPLRSEKKYPNVPANIPLIAQKIADIKKVSVKEVAKKTTENARALFNMVE